MKTTLAAATFVLLGAGTAAIGAVNLTGSDPLEDLVKFMLNNGFCAGTSTIVYQGGGSSGGEAAMISGAQEVAPMSRALNANVCQLATNASATDNPGTAYNVLVCLEAMAIIANKYAAPTRPYSLCSVKHLASSIPITEAGDCVGCNGTNYDIANDDWRDVLKVLYAGVHHNGVKDCDSAVRRTLAQNYGQVFQGTCSPDTTAPFGGCGPIQHLFRLGDVSTALDSFLSLLQLPSRGATSFCNSPAGVPGTYSSYRPPINNADYIDEDPIRRPCLGAGENPAPGAGEQICNHADPATETPAKPAAWKNTLGIVLPVTVPANLSAASNYPTDFCTFGEFEYRNASGLTRCPDGQNPTSYANTCFIPLRRDPVTGVVTFNCISRASNRGIYMSAVAGDGRIHNLPLRNAAGTILRDEFTRRVLAGFSRIHTNRVLANAAECTDGCREATATRQIGCLVGASPCSQGFAGLPAVSPTACTTALRVRGLEPTNSSIQNLVLGGSPYPFSRRWYFNSTVATFTDPAQANLMGCFRNRPQAEAACVAAGQVVLPGPPICLDFDEAAAATAYPRPPNSTMCVNWLASNPRRDACSP